MTVSQKQNPIPPPNPSATRPAEDASSERPLTPAKARKRAIRAREAEIDAALEMTFPASDPPAW